MKAVHNNIQPVSFNAKLTLRGDIDVLSIKEKEILKEITSSFAHGKSDAVDVFIGLRMYPNASNHNCESRDVVMATYLNKELLARKVHYPDWKNKEFCKNPFQYIMKNLLDIKANFLKNNQ